MDELNEQRLLELGATPVQDPGSEEESWWEWTPAAGVRFRFYRSGKPSSYDVYLNSRKAEGIRTVSQLLVFCYRAGQVEGKLQECDRVRGFFQDLLGLMECDGEVAPGKEGRE